MTAATRILSAGRRFPCCGGTARFPDLMPGERTCRNCKAKYHVTFESALIGPTLGRELWKAIWSALS